MDHLRRLVGLSGVLSYLVVPAALAAQVSGGGGFYGSIEDADPIPRTLGAGGLSPTPGPPYWEIRGSGGIGTSSLASPGTVTSQNPSNLVWATNADLLL